VTRRSCRCASGHKHDPSCGRRLLVLAAVRESEYLPRLHRQFSALAARYDSDNSVVAWHAISVYLRASLGLPGQCSSHAEQSVCTTEAWLPIVLARHGNSQVRRWRRPG
jgi:hypothetical protein